MEYLQLFDDDKNMLQEKIARSEEKNVSLGRYFMIVLVFIENDKHEFLIQKTSVSRNSVYATTGGHVTYGDTSLETVVKEVKEELGINMDESEAEFITSIKHSIAYCEIYYVHKNIDIKDLILQEEKVESADWYSVEEINKLIENGEFRKGNIKEFKLVLDWINKKK